MENTTKSMRSRPLMPWRCPSWLMILVLVTTIWTRSAAGADDSVVRVFIFAGQSNMVGSDSKVTDIDRFPPFSGLDAPQVGTRFSYCIGRERKSKSDGWVDLQPVNNVVGPELSFARELQRNDASPVAIIKVAAGGTHLGGDWNPDDPIGFKMYPLALNWVKEALDDLDKQGVHYRLEGFMWHQGENDMFNEDYKANYGKNLKNFLACWRRDLNQPELRFYIGELCTKTIWGMDLRPRMYAISLGQKEVAENDPLAQYVPTSHVGVEIGGGVGLHYHYGTLGQLEHGVNYADAYLRNAGLKRAEPNRALQQMPWKKGEKVKLFVLAGHRNMEGERAFVQELAGLPSGEALLKDVGDVAYKYDVAGSYKVSGGWEPLGPSGPYDTFGPELSFGAALHDAGVGNVAIAKFTHSGSQIIDWTPEGSEAVSRNLFPKFVSFVRESIDDLADRGFEVELAGIFYHVGENDMSWGPFRKGAAARIVSFVNGTRSELNHSELPFFVSHQPPTDDKRVNGIDVTSAIREIAKNDKHLTLIDAFEFPPQDKKLVLDTKGIVWLGSKIAASYLAAEANQP